MAPWSWRRAAAGIGVFGLLGFTAAGTPLADPAGGAGQPAVPAQLDLQTSMPPEVRAHPPDATRQPAPEVAPAAATSKAEPLPSPAVYTDNGIPRVALRAYRNAAELLGRPDPSCHLHWSLLAAIGRVESDHGRHGGSSLYRSGETTSPIVGPALDGSGNTARIMDSDGGQLDGDARFDRAVGPMQFLPGTWRLAGVDGDGDGQADPTNIFDAALSAGRYLCAGTVDLSDPQGLRDAVYRYNHSASYVDLVLSIAKAYRQGDTEPSLPPAPGDVTPPEPVEPTPPEGDLPPATSGEPPATLEGPDGDGTPPPDGEPPTGETPGGETETPSPPSDEEPEPPPSNEPTEPPDDESPSPPDDGSHPDGDEPAAPEVSDVEPAEGPVGTEVTITGSGLEDADAVSFGGQETEVAPESAEKIVVEAPAYPEAGPVEVTVSGEGGASTAPTEFTYLPTIEDIEPAEGSTEGGDEVTVTGTSLRGAVVSFGGTEVEPSSSNSGTELEVTTPPADETGEVDVTASHAGETSGAGTYTYEAPAASIEPASGAAGEPHEVTIQASYTEFAEEPTVTAADASGEPDELDVTRESDTELVATLPEHEPGDVTVTVHRSGDDLSTTFTYRPHVDGMEPQPATPGEAVTLHGAGLDAESAIVIAGRAEEIPVEEGTSDSLAFTVPEKLEPGHHELMVTTSGVSSAPYDFEVGKDG